MPLGICPPAFQLCIARNRALTPKTGDGPAAEAAALSSCALPPLSPPSMPYSSAALVGRRQQTRKGVEDRHQRGAEARDKSMNLSVREDEGNEMNDDCAPNWAAPEPCLSLKKKFEALSNPNPIHAKPLETAMAGGEGSSRSKSAKRKAEAMKEVVTTDEAAPGGDIPCIEDPISYWPTSILKEKYIKNLEADGFLATQEISRWRCAHRHEYPTEETEELTGMKPVYLDYATKESLKDWQKEWFYAWNHQPQLPSCSGNPLVMKPFWSETIGIDQAMEIPKLLNMITDLKAQGLTEAMVYRSFLLRRIQPYKQRCNPGYSYSGETDPSRNTTGDMPDRRIIQLLKNLPPLDPTNAEEATLLARCVDPGVRDQVRQHKRRTENAPASEEPDEPHAQIEQQVSEEPRTKAGATSKRGEGSKRAASSELNAHVPKRARTLPKPRIRVIPEEKTKISLQPKMPSSVGIANGEIGTSRSQQSGIAQQPLLEEEIIHNIYNPFSTSGKRTLPSWSIAPEQEAEEEFTLGELEIPMRPSTLEEPAIDHAAVEPEAAVPEESREMPETTLPEVQPAASSSLPVLVEAQVEETIAEVLADIEQLVTQANTAEPPSVMETFQVGAKAVPEAECSRGKQAETSAQEQTIEEIPRVPKGTGAEEEIGSFRIRSFDPMLNPNLQTFEYILDAEEDEEHIDRGLYHAERAVAYFKAVGKASRKKTEYIHNISLMHAKADRLQKELEREREDRKLQEAEDANVIRTLHLRTKELAAEKEDMKKKLSSKMTDWSNLANRHEEALKTLSAEHDIIKEQLRVVVQQRKDADLQLIQTLDEKLEQATKRMSELEEAMQQMKKSDEDLAEALKRISLLEKAANPVVKVLVPEDPAAPQSFLERLKALPRQLKAYIRRSSKACLVHVLAVIKSRYPKVDIGKLVEGAEPNCTEAAFRDLKQEAEPVAEAIAQSLRL
nr:unnamed protein product [Digitaria exilis]